MMRPVAFLVVVAVWVGLWGSPSWANLMTGIGVALALALLLKGSAGSADRHVVHPLAMVSLVLWFVVELVKANVVVAWEIVRPGSRIVPGVVAVPLRTGSRLCATILANVITLTPGTLSIEVDLEARLLFVHALKAPDPEALRSELGAIQDRVLRAIAPVGD